MANKSIKQLFFSVLFLFSLNFIPNLAEAAPTDCVQTATDGTINCIKAQNFWAGTIAAPRFSNFEDYKNFAITTSCGTVGPGGGCGEKLTNGPINGLPCNPGQACNELSHIKPNNLYGVAVQYYYSSQSTGYNVNPIQSHNHFLCPVGFTQVSPDTNYGLVFCKPPSSVQTVDLRCPNGNCPSASDYLSGASTVGQPVAVGSGNKYVVENDYNYNAYWPINYTRFYNSKILSWTNNWNYTLGYSDFAPAGKVVSVFLPNGSSWSYKFDAVNNKWNSTNSVDVNKLTHDINTGEFTYFMDNNNQVVFYPQVGTALSNGNTWQAKRIIMLGGGQYFLTYDPTGNLTKVINPNGVELTINYSITVAGCSSRPVVTSIVGLNNTTTSYSYDSSCQLNKVTYPDSTFKTYVYQSERVAEIKDEVGNILESSQYNSVINRPGLVALQDGSGINAAINKVSLTYNATSTVVTDGLNHSATINLLNQNGQLKPSSYSTLCTWCDGIQGSAITYNPNGFMTSVTDFKGNVTQFGYDTTRNLLTQITESTNNAPLQRQTTITYDPNWRLPSTITEPSGVLVSGSYNNRVTNNVYEVATGRLIYKSMTAPTSEFNSNLIFRNWNMSYDPLGQLTEVKNPRYTSSINDKTNYTYSPTGQISTIVNGLNQTTTFSNFDSYGNPQTVTNKDGTSVNLVYNSRGKVISVTKVNIGNTASYTTGIARKLNGLVDKVTSPSGAYKKLVYDTANRITQLEEYNESNTYLGKTVFTLDVMSNPTKVQVFDAANVEIRLMTKQYDAKNLLFKDLTALNNPTTYTYDSNGNLTNIMDANSKNLSYTYDSLNRIATQTNPDTGVIALTYNPDDSVASVNSPNNSLTTYKYNGFGEILNISSPDTGPTNIGRDIGGNMISKITTANITYTYDAINRVDFINYTNNTGFTDIAYDYCNNGMGKICRIFENNGSLVFTIDYTYDSFGRIDSKKYTEGSLMKTTFYSYDAQSRLNKITYPSGMTVDYTYSNNKQVSVSYTINGITTPVVTNGTYDPFSSMIKSYQFGNGSTYTKAFDKDGMTTGVSTSVAGLNVNQGFTFDPLLNINSITGFNSAIATYDFNSRLKTFGGKTYNYDLNSNRTSVVNGGTTTYNNTPNTNRLSSLSGAVTDSFSYDGNGNQSNAMNKMFTFNLNNMLKGYIAPGQNYSYVVSYFGQRYKKIDNFMPINTKTFIYNGNNIIAEYDNAGLVSSEYIYLNGQPVGMVKNNNLYYIYSDYLGTPRTLTDTSNNVVWKWDNVDPFGSNLPSIQTVEFNFRLPGQYFDSETGLHYNYFRTYNPQTGKYISSDPIGLDGGTNTYGYVDANPLNATDELGLMWQYVLPTAVGGVAGGIIGGWADGVAGIKKGVVTGAITGLSISGAGRIIGAVVGEGILTQVGANVIGAATGELSQQLLFNNCNIDLDYIGAAALSGLILSPVSKPYILANQNVVTWASKGITPDLNSGRWVMNGYNNIRNYGLAGVTYAPRNNFVEGAVMGK